MFAFIQFKYLLINLSMDCSFVGKVLATLNMGIYLTLEHITILMKNTYYTSKLLFISKRPWCHTKNDTTNVQKIRLSKPINKFCSSYSSDIQKVISNTVFKGKKLPNVWKKYPKNEGHLCLVVYIFTKLSQNVFLINTHILMYWHSRCN